MYTWLGAQIDAMTMSYLAGAIAKVIAYANPVAMGALILWIYRYAYAAARGAVNEPALDFMMKSVRVALVIYTASRPDVYQVWVVDGYKGVLADLLTAFALPGSPMQGATSSWAALDSYNKMASDLAWQMLSGTFLKMNMLVSILVGGLFSLFHIFFLGVAFFVSMVGNVIGGFFLSIGPIFLYALIHDVTTKFFWAWLGFVLGLILLSWIVFFTLGFALGVAALVVSLAVKGGETINILGMTLIFCSVMFSLLVLLYQSPQFASGLVGGSPPQTGAQMLMQIWQAYRFGKTPEKPGDDKKNTGQENTPAGYRAGQYVGNQARAAFQRAADAWRR